MFVWFELFSSMINITESPSYWMHCHTLKPLASHSESTLTLPHMSPCILSTLCLSFLLTFFPLILKVSLNTHELISHAVSLLSVVCQQATGNTTAEIWQVEIKPTSVLCMGVTPEAYVRAVKDGSRSEPGHICDNQYTCSMFYLSQTMCPLEGTWIWHMMLYFRAGGDGVGDGGSSSMA